jgi:hypothetical protein
MNERQLSRRLCLHNGREWPKELMRLKRPRVCHVWAKGPIFGGTTSLIMKRNTGLISGCSSVLFKGPIPGMSHA